MMTVKELIEYLDKIPDDYVVKVTRDGIDGDLYRNDLKYGLSEERKEIVL